MTSLKEDDKFIEDVVVPALRHTPHHSMLQDAIDWICKNLKPHDVFDQKQLDEWATEYGYVKP